MPKKPAKHGQEWTDADVGKLRRMAKQDLDTDKIARRLQRSLGAVYGKASDEDISLMPKDK